MAITFSLPESVEAQLRVAFANLDEVAKEAALVELFRQGELSSGRLAEALGVSRMEADAVLKRHGVVEDLPTLEEYNAERAELHRLMGQ